MEQIVWDEKYNIGVEVVDTAHAKLFRIMKKLMDISQDNSGDGYQSTYREMIKYLETYSMTHFSEEEEYMRSIRYKSYGHHKKIHDSFRDKTLVSLKKDLELSGYSGSAVQRFVAIMSGWLSEHIMKEDQAIVGRGNARKGRDLSSQIGIISRAANRVAQEVFQVEAKLDSAEYKGHNIGKGFYCRQWYDTEGGIRLQFLLGMEEPLMARGITRMVRKGEGTKENILLVFQQILEHMGKIFRAEAADELTKDNLLDRDGFRADFMKGYPCSLLFSTKIGYFVFCYRSWRVKNQKADA